MTDLRIAVVIFGRTWTKVVRRPVVLLLSFVQPLIWMAFFGFLFHRFDLSGFGETIRYIDFLLPGVCAMTVLLGGSQSGIGFIRDMQTGFLERLLATPARRGCLLVGKVAGDVSRLLGQALMVAILGVLLGARLQPSIGPVLLATVNLMVFSVAWCCLSSLIALKTQSQESMAAFVHVVNMPVFFTSTALVPSRQMPDWLEVIARWNPLTRVVDPLRAALLQGTWTGDFATFAALLMLAATLFVAATMALKTAARQST